MNNVIPDIPRFYTAIAEWLSCLVMVILLKPKIEKNKFIIASVCYLALLIPFMELTESVKIWFWIPCMMIAFFSMTGFIYLTAKLSFYKSVYYATLAFSVAELTASLEWQIINLIYTDVTTMHWAPKHGIFILVYAAVMLIEHQILGKRMAKNRDLTLSHEAWITALLIGIFVFGGSNLRFITDDASLYYREIANVRTLVDIAGVAILYAHYLSLCNNAVLNELGAVQKTLETQYQQYKQSRESIDLINMRYHDMKHQIQYLRSEQDADKRNEFLDMMEKEIKTFEVQNKTGNPVLDTILTGKSLYCYKHGITMTSVADGKLLDFMDAFDISNIFGNALDNAIESAMAIEDKEKRLIHVTVSQVNDFVMIRIENYYEGQLRTDGDNFLTTKNDEKYHGYGIKSIKYTANKYDGAVYINTDNNWFDIKIAIPKKS